MRYIMKEHITSTLLILMGLSSFSYAESIPNLPQSTQINAEENKSSSIEIVDEIVIQTGDNSQKENPKLKEGEACDDSEEALAPATLLPDEYQDIPMAKTIPCDKINCDNLTSAKLMKDTYKKIPMAKTTKVRHCESKKK